MAGTGFQWDPYKNPTMQNPMAGQSGNFNFWRPADSKLPTGQALQDYLLGGNGTPGAETNRTVKYDGGLTREMMGNGFGFLNTNIGEGFTQLSDQLNYGGVYGNGGRGRVFSPQSGNGYAGGWGASSPFNIGSF